MSRTKKTEETPFDSFAAGLPASVVAANKPVGDDDEPEHQDKGQPPAAAAGTPDQRQQSRAVIPGARKVYTREDFSGAQSWSSGFSCDKCGCQDLRVFRTERLIDSQAVVRTRICRNCATVKRTVEQ